jgi:hypothetical protein
MAESIDNDLLLGLSGRFGKMFSLRQWFGRTIAARRPRGRNGAPGTPPQELHKERFKEAAIYATGVINNEVTKKTYSDLASKGTNAFSRAVGDFLKAPIINSINTEGYKGLVNDILVIRAVDDFKVTSVTVAIHAADGQLLEEGNALLAGNNADWFYTAVAANGAVAGSKVTARAKDMAGNVTSQEITL